MNGAMRRHAASATVVAIILAVGLVAVQAAAGSDNPGKGMTIDLYSRLTDLNGIAQPSQPGDEGYVGRDLYALGGDPSSPVPIGEPIGRLVGVCTLVTASEGICHGVYDLTGRGTLTAYLELEVGSGVNHVAITGGTGEFAGASGTAEEAFVPGSFPDQVLHLELHGFNQP